ncbi:Vasoactive intestinal polypeptide receptor 2 [Dissostichus eleginoides]|uniref:Vasoactive intestinal polypeptide receptor 2 n=1 Tax=Dissostichus eleginoides TaxID=100907 RepID=A0AAD9BLQ4_DISEL|nr:Vasoactive intestinal polypeptide receptor 2 [Dissostichus eleginoides]
MEANLSYTLALLLLGCTFIHTVNGKFPHCQFYWEMQRAKKECQILRMRNPQTSNLQRIHSFMFLYVPDGWQEISGFESRSSAKQEVSADFNEVRTLPCPSPILRLFGKNDAGLTLSGCSWELQLLCNPPPLKEAAQPAVEHRFNSAVSERKTERWREACFGHRRKCGCSDPSRQTSCSSQTTKTHCSTQPSLVDCKASLVFFNYFIMANFFWLLVEGLYLHTLLLVIHRYSTRLSTYMLIGWGIPFVFMVAWIICRINLEDTRCWEMNENPIPNRLINWPIMASVIINFILFISIIRILVQKLRCTDVGGNEQSQYRRLAKSTLLLIPLFGVNYVVFVYLVEPTDKNMNQIKIFFDLALGSFQGLIVAVLYCFLNSEVQSELRRTWRSLSLKRYVGRDYRPHAMSMSRNGTENSAHFPRNSRAQSILQTETTVL